MPSPPPPPPLPIYDETFAGVVGGGVSGWNGSGGAIGLDVHAIPSGRLYFGNPQFSIWKYFNVQKSLWLYWGFSLNPNFLPSGGFLTIQNAIPNVAQDTEPITLLTVGIDPDYGLTLIGPLNGKSIYLLNGSNNPANSMIQTSFNVCANTWFFCELQVNIIDNPHDNNILNDTIGIGANLWVNGQQVCSGSIADTGIRVGDTHTLGPNCNKTGWSNPSGDGGAIANLTCQVSAGYPHLPNPYKDDFGNILINCDLSQGVVEYIQQYKDNQLNVRMSQAVVEYAKQQNNTNAKLSEDVIELITQGGVASLTGWQVKEI